MVLRQQVDLRANLGADLSRVLVGSYHRGRTMGARTAQRVRNGDEYPQPSQVDNREMRIEQKYGAILADPPWAFKAWSGYTIPTRVDQRWDLAANHYPPMLIDDICRLPVSDYVNDDCALFCWVTWPTLLDGLRAIEAWGFTYKTCAFCWVKGNTLPLFPDDFKDKMGLGYWTRANSEVCLLATRGSPKRSNADVRQVIQAPLREHSRKPDEIYTRIERLVAGPYLEIFARQRWPGWDQWGNETDRFPT